MLVHWKGYDDITWEPLENLLGDVPEMVEDFVIDRWGIQTNDITTCKYKGETYYVVPEVSAA